MSRILLIDDDDCLRTVLQLTLEKAGHTVTVARDGREGVAGFKKETFDLVLTDIIMPEQDGIETIMELRRRSPQLKIIAMSGGGRMTATGCLRIARKLGATQVLAKPFSPEELDVALRAVLGDEAARPGL